MISNLLQQTIIDHVKSYSGIQVKECKWFAVGGGSINTAYCVQVNDTYKFFLKLNDNVGLSGLFTAEKEGLLLLGSHKVIRVPTVIAEGKTGNVQYLLLEWIEQGEKSQSFWESMGSQLAGLHYISGQTYGLDANNFIGSLPQSNDKAPTWCQFFVEERLRPLVKRAVDNNYLQTQHLHQFDGLYKRLEEIFPEEGKSSLLHGDLWSGNYCCDLNSQPVLIDPAVYYGHHSMDMAKTTLFGGFDPVFYESYQYYFPSPANYKEQWEICNLYPLLVHLILFGKNYLPEILYTIRRY